MNEEQRLNKMDMWTELNLGTEWGLDFLDHPNGLFGDPKDASRLGGDMNTANKPGDAVEQLAYSPESEGPLDFEWMESGDLGSFLDALDDRQNKVHPLEDSLFDCSRELVSKDTSADTQTEILATTTPFLFGNEQVDNLHQALTPPLSPEQVTPVIKLDPEISTLWTCDIVSADSNQNISLPLQKLSTHLEPPFVEYVDASDFVVEEVDSTTLEPPFVEYVDASDFLVEEVDLKQNLFEVSDLFNSTISSPELVSNSAEDVLSAYSSDDGTSNSSPEPSPRPDIDSLILSSPELYKVIATPSSLSSRFSPYTKAKSESKDKSESKASKSRKGKQSPEPIPEELFPCHLGKRERKKLQNKNAAIRYRQKKKAEVDNIVTEVQGLEDKNESLKLKVDDLQREIKYMKSLMQDIYKAKGIIKG